MEDSQFKIGQICKHEIDLKTIQFKKGFSKGRCKKCGMWLTRLYPVNINPKRIKEHSTKKQRRKKRIKE